MYGPSAFPQNQTLNVNEISHTLRRGFHGGFLIVCFSNLLICMLFDFHSGGLVYDSALINIMVYPSTAWSKHTQTVKSRVDLIVLAIVTLHH